MAVDFPSRPLTSAEADVLKTAYETAITEASYTELVIKKYLWPSYQVAPIPLSLEADFDAADDTKKQNMIMIAKQVLSEAPEDYNTRYGELYAEAYP